MQASQEHFTTTVQVKFEGKLRVLWATGKQRTEDHNKPFLSSLVTLFQNKSWFKTFLMKMSRQNLFSSEWFPTRTRFDMETKSISEMGCLDPSRKPWLHAMGDTSTYKSLHFRLNQNVDSRSSLRGRPQKGRKVKMSAGGRSAGGRSAGGRSAGGRRNGLQGRYCFLCFFRPPDERENPDWSDLRIT